MAFRGLPFRRLGNSPRMNVTWKLEGACRWVEPDLFFPVSDADAEPARSVCAGCGVREHCLEYSIDVRDFEGVWGGLTGPERRALDRRRRATVPA
jgi:WhiB family redox-sensing transcriptional regulator